MMSTLGRSPSYNQSKVFFLFLTCLSLPFTILIIIIITITTVFAESSCDLQYWTPTNYDVVRFFHSITYFS